MPVFALCDELFPDVFASICAVLSKQIYEQKEYVFTAGSWNTHCYISTAGQFSYVDGYDTDAPPLEIQGEACFAELSLYAEASMHQATLTATYLCGNVCAQRSRPCRPVFVSRQDVHQCSVSMPRNTSMQSRRRVCKLGSFTGIPQFYSGCNFAPAAFPAVAGEWWSWWLRFWGDSVCFFGYCRPC